MKGKRRWDCEKQERKNYSHVIATKDLKGDILPPAADLTELTSPSRDQEADLVLMAAEATPRTCGNLQICRNLILNSPGTACAGRSVISRTTFAVWGLTDDGTSPSSSTTSSLAYAMKAVVPIAFLASINLWVFTLSTLRDWEAELLRSHHDSKVESKEEPGALEFARQSAL